MGTVTVTDFIGAPDNEMLFCGIELGYAGSATW
jgi:hypothetical protein